MPASGPRLPHAASRIDQIGRALMRLESARNHVDERIATLRRLQAKMTN